VFTRRGNDWTKRFKKIADDAWHIGAGSAIIDGEVIVPSENGVSDFSVLQNELRGKSNKLMLYAFDLLYLNGFDLRKAPLFERKALLRKLVATTEILFSESFETDGAAMFKQACKMGLEGVVSKIRDGRYISGRGKDWVKVTCRQRETLPIAGFALKDNRFDGLYIGRQEGDELIYAGKVDHGFDNASAKDSADPTKAADPQDATLRQEDRAPRRVGRTFVARRNRVSCKVSRGQGASPVFQGHPGGSVMADLVYNLVKGPVGWVLFIDGTRTGGVYGTKEAAFEAAMVAASFAVRDGDGVHIDVPSDATLRATEKVDPWPKEWSAFLK
jgi:ATP dependent DNA ligase domain